MAHVEDKDLVDLHGCLPGLLGSQSCSHDYRVIQPEKSASVVTFRLGQ